MPFINGKFYMNPAYGRAMERATGREVWSEEPDGDIAASYLNTQQRKAAADVKTGGKGNTATQYDNAQNEREARLANVVYNETSGLRAKKGTKPGVPGSEEDLHKARVAVAEIARRDMDSGHPKRVAPSELKPTEGKALGRGNPEAVRAHNDSLAAARQALAGSDTTSGATQYRLRPVAHTRIRIAGRPVTGRYGPFEDVQGKSQNVVIAP